MARSKKSLEDWLEPDNMQKIHDWVRAGCTRAQVAKNMGINRRTLFRWCDESVAFATQIKKCDDAVVEEIEGYLYKACKDGNVAAMIFALKNRGKEKWKDKLETESKVEIENTSSLSMMLKMDDDDDAAE